VREEWHTGTPLSTSKNVQEGRYAPAVIANKFEINVKLAEQMVGQWLNVRPAVLQVSVVDKKSKQKGLQVVGSIDG
jgi:hypothetical protein